MRPEFIQVKRRNSAHGRREDPAIQQRFKEDNPIVQKLLPPGAPDLFRLYKLQPETVEMVTGLVPYTRVAW